MKLFNATLLLGVLFATSCSKSKISAKENTPEEIAETTEKLIAFPEAEGFGKYATGGRGGKVVEVTNLKDAGYGSFRQALLEYPGEPITIVFTVAGNIELQTDIKINRSNITIAGQTAPGDGICLSGRSFIINGAKAGGNHGNIIIRYLRSRPGTFVGTGIYGFDMENCHDVIVDHCSFSWANEECAALYDTKNTSVQWCIISEGLWNAGHAKGNRGYGGVWGGQNASFHHNLIANQNSRAIRFNGARAHDTLAVVDYRNNVIYNWGNNNACAGGSIEIPGGKSQINMVNNYYKPGPAAPGTIKFCQADYNETGTFGFGQWHMSGNIMEGHANLTSDNWAGLDLAKMPVVHHAAAKVSSPFKVEDIKTQSTLEAYESVLLSAGASLPKRDAVDARVVNETKTGTAMGMGSFNKPGIIDNALAVGGWPIYSAPGPVIDSDHDGMPDSWEDENKTDKYDPSDRNKIHSSGYTMLEVYMNNIK